MAVSWKLEVEVVEKILMASKVWKVWIGETRGGCDWCVEMRRP